MIASATTAAMTGMSGMSVMTQTATGSAAMASSTGMSMGGGGMSMGGGCKISMLWNWYTVDSCFIARSWHITSKSMFAGSCIGVILLVISLEALRRAGKEYDRYIVNQYLSSHVPTTAVASSASSDNSKTPATTAAHTPTAQNFRPSVFQQAVRALLHVLQFAVAYFVMLLAMYYNGYIIICIFIGAYLGYFICGWESFNVGKGGQDRMQENVTVCCG
ncbi:Ctr-domain-containing protein [Macroventuria anomochaeta]|uniref:Ctr-domain-containing protein n=1 Tax=Macroventuria anomochaeta TaxID=301207 RepID=A0ACB6SDL5_9PLEO|nr:Ctr-domain-containing protein [Macroventuria anomochaeta]KAF2631690.1 Ctr-domain-containing protein [Macroventuria anomochaeta]